MPKIRFTNISVGNFQDADAALPMDAEDYSDPGATVRPKVFRVGSAAAVVLAPYNIAPPTIAGSAAVGQTLSLVDNSWTGATSLNYRWLVDGVQVATTATYVVVSGDQGKVITAECQGVGAVASSFVPATNAVFIPVVGETVVENGEWETYEAPADADTRRMFAVVNDTPTALYEFAFYRGTNPDGDLTALGAMVFNVDRYEATSVGRAGIGTPSARSIQYIRIAERLIANPTGVNRWVSETKSYFASSVPAAPTVALSAGSQGEIVIDITIPADGSGRAVLSYEYQLNGGAWVAMAGGVATGARVIGGLTPVTLYSVAVRGTNANGVGVAASGSVTSGSAATAPAAFGSVDWDVVDKPSLDGDVLTLSFSTLPANGGSAITGVFYKVNGGSPVSLGTTPTSVDITGITPAESPTDIIIYASNAVGAGTQSSKTKTPTKIATASTAYFGELTETGDGGWKPETSAGDEVDITGIVSQVGMTRTWALTSGNADPAQNNALVCTGGTPLVDDTKTLTVSTAAGNIVVTIACVTDAWSVADKSQLSRILGRSAVAPRSILLRPRLYDLGRGSGSATPTGNGVFQSRTYTAGTRRTLTIHPGQIRFPRSEDTCSRMYDAQYLTIDKFDFKVLTTAFNKYTPFLQGGKGGGSGNKGLKITNCNFLAPEIPPEVLNDPTVWPTGYTGVSAVGINLASTGGTSWDTEISGCYFRALWFAGEITVRGNFILTDNVVDQFYFDGFRLKGATSSWGGVFPDNGEWKMIARNKYLNPFGAYNEMGSNAPHCDPQQLIDGAIYNCLWWQNVSTPGETRVGKLSFYQTNGFFYRCTFGGEVGVHKGPDMAWGINASGGGYLVFANTTLLHTSESGSKIRISDSGSAYGELLFQNVWCRDTSSGAGAISANGTNFAAIDPVRIVKVNTIDTNGISIPANFNWTEDWSTVETSLASATPKVGGLAAANGVGALNTAGGYRTEEWPPMHGEKPTLANAGADVLITPAVSKLAYTTPASWEYITRNPAVNVNWNAAVTGLTGPNATLVAPNKTGLEVMCRWVGTNGLKGTWSEIQTVIV